MIRTAAALIALLALAPAYAGAQAPDSASTPPDAGSSAGPSRTASFSNPAISVIGWFQGVAGNDLATQDRAFELREAELGFQAAVDPFTRADFFLSAGPEGLDVEEGYITWLALPGGGQAKLGRFRADLGKFNRTHPPETPFADRPLSTVSFFGAEGLTTTGVSVSALIPNPLALYWDATANVGAVPAAGESPVFSPGARSDLLAVGRTSMFVPLRESADLNLGVSYASAPPDSSLRPEGNRAQIAAGDVTIHWKNPRRSIYRSLFAQAEVLAEQGSASGATRRGGAFGYVVWQFARQWRVGARVDRTDSPFAGGRSRGVLGLLTYQPSEFSTLSVQARRVHDFDGRDRDAAFFKWTFNIGPHGAHPY